MNEAHGHWRTTDSRPTECEETLDFQSGWRWTEGVCRKSRMTFLSFHSPLDVSSATCIRSLNRSETEQNKRRDKHEKPSRGLCYVWKLIWAKSKNGSFLNISQEKPYDVRRHVLGVARLQVFRDENKPQLRDCTSSWRQIEVSCSSVSPQCWS